MMKSFYEQMGGTYHWEGGYRIPDLVLDEPPVVGLWGQRYRRYLKQHRRAVYTEMLLNGTLDDHVAEIDRQAEEMLDRLIRQMAAREGITEQCKASDQMAWVGAMNNIRARAEEVVNAELIFN